MRYAQIRSMDISNGIGIGAALFVQGCPFHCKGCFNQETWEFNRGKEFTKEIEDDFINICKNPYISRVSILGGEPLCKENIATVYKLIQKIKGKKQLWIYTGYTYEELSDEQKNYIKDADILVDGRFEIDKKDLMLKFRGSSNQRIIDIHKTIELGEVVCLNL